MKKPQIALTEEQVLEANLKALGIAALDARSNLDRIFDVAVSLAKKLGRPANSAEIGHELGLSSSSVCNMLTRLATAGRMIRIRSGQRSIYVPKVV